MGHAEFQQRQYTAEEYFALEMKSEARHDFYEGQIIERPGDTVTHNTIVMNCMMVFRQALRHSENHVYTLGILLVVRENEHYTYPNLMVCGQDEGAGEIALIRQPLLLLEVLYPETQEYDQGRKFNQYKNLPSLRHYLLVSQKEWLVEWYQLTEHGVWSHTVLAEATDAITIPELGLTMTMAELY